MERDQQQAYSYIKKETLAQVFSCEFCENFKNNIFTEHLQTAASEKAYQSYICEFMKAT